jgi:hypothetical protein
MRARRALAAVLLVAAPACTVGVRRDARESRTPRPVVSISVPPCRPAYAPPDPKRPRIALTFDVDDSHGRVTGTERVQFTPDRPITELVFRLWANGPVPVRNGGRIEVTNASLPMSFESAGGAEGTQGTLLRLALPAALPAGSFVVADLEFTLTLPRAAVDRWGHTARTAWWASAHPMLAWVRGSGWQTTPAIGMLAETAATETAAYDVTVVAPAGDSVLVLETEDLPVATAEGKRRWHFVHDAARDVAVSVGPFQVRREVMSGVPVAVAVSDELASGTGAERVFGPVTTLVRDSLREFRARFGPFPYPSFTVVALEPIRGAGVEYPGLVWVGSRRYDVVVPHEVAHEWFYGLVGNDQGNHPWLDESFASYGEALVDEASADRFVGLVDSDGEVGRPMSYWDRHRDDYGRVVYAKGAGALLTARAATGAAAFDALLRCFIRENAHRVATPEDVRRAFAPSPRAVEILRAVGALS